MSLLNASAVIGATGGLWIIYKLGQIGKRGADLPPGPPTVPLLGNLHQLSTTNIHYQLTEWAERYGDVYSLKFGPGTVVVLTSPAAVREILDKHSAVTSDRPPNHIVDLVTDDKNLGGSNYSGPHWKKLRRAAQQLLMPQACERHVSIQQAEATQLMYDLLTHPEDFYNAIRRFSTSVVLCMLFGKRAPQYSTHEVAAFFHVQHLWEQALEPGAHPPIDLVPVLKLVPERFARWKTLSKEVRRLQRELYFGLLEDVEARLARGQGNGCFVEEICARAEEWGMERDLIGTFGGSLMEAGSDTTSSFMQTLILVLVAYPEIQKKAQEEIDRVIGPDRAPVVTDIEHLPYVQAIIKETYRFRPVAPLGVPHYATGDVMYKGYRIPSGTTIFMNIWGIHHDDKIYENESAFDPERYTKNPFGIREELVEDLKNWKEDVQFGAGRRVCPGIQLAKNSVAINAVNFLWAFNFGKAKDSATGADIEVDVWDYVNGLGTCPTPFKCAITPRSPRHAEIIRQQFAEATSGLSTFEHELSEEDCWFVRKQRGSH